MEMSQRKIEQRKEIGKELKEIAIILRELQEKNINFNVVDKLYKKYRNSKYSLTMAINESYMYTMSARNNSWTVYDLKKTKNVLELINRIILDDQGEDYTKMIELCNTHILGNN